MKCKQCGTENGDEFRFCSMCGTPLVTSPVVEANHYVYLDEQVQGPYSITQIQAMLEAGGIEPETLFCPEGQQEWRPISILLGLRPSPPAPPQKSEPKADVKNTKPCPYCGDAILFTATRCNHCGGELKFCPKCHRTVAIRTQNKWVGVFRGGTQVVGFCQNCGTKLFGPSW